MEEAILGSVSCRFVLAHTLPAPFEDPTKTTQQKCCILSLMIPQFTDEGLLLPGVHQTDLEELKEKMGWSRRDGSYSRVSKRPWS